MSRLTLAASTYSRRKFARPRASVDLSLSWKHLRAGDCSTDVAASHSSALITRSDDDYTTRGRASKAARSQAEPLRTSHPCPVASATANAIMGWDRQQVPYLLDRRTSLCRRSYRRCWSAKILHAASGTTRRRRFQQDGRAARCHVDRRHRRTGRVSGVARLPCQTPRILHAGIKLDKRKQPESLPANHPGPSSSPRPCSPSSPTGWPAWRSRPTATPWPRGAMALRNSSTWPTSRKLPR